jgi:hypothetical protein
MSIILATRGMILGTSDMYEYVYITPISGVIKNVPIQLTGYIKDTTKLTGTIEEGVVTTSEATYLSIEIEAQETIPAYSVITSDGYIASSADITQRSKILGVATSYTISGHIIPVATDGEIVDLSWSWTKGQPLYLNGTTISHTPPTSGYLIRLGEASDTTKMYIEISDSILL